MIVRHWNFPCSFNYHIIIIDGVMCITKCYEFTAIKYNHFGTYSVVCRHHFVRQHFVMMMKNGSDWLKKAHDDKVNKHIYDKLITTLLHYKLSVWLFLFFFTGYLSFAISFVGFFCPLLSYMNIVTWSLVHWTNNQCNQSMQIK